MNRLHKTDGFAAVTAVLVVIIAGLVMVAISVSTMTAVQNSKSAAEGAQAIPVIDTAIHSYQVALEREYVSDINDFVLTKQTMDMLVSAQVNESVVYTSSLNTIPDSYTTTVGVREGSTITQFPADAQITVRMALDGTGLTQRFQNWNIYRIDLPNYDNPDVGSALTVYFRGWEQLANGKIVVPQQFMRVQFRPGLFSDYQMLTDAPLQFGDGAQIDAPVHTNGYDDFSRISPPSGVRLWNTGTLQCGKNALMSTSNGAISINNPDCAQVVEKTSAINFLRAQRTFDSIARDCTLSATDKVHCLAAPAPGDKYRVVLEPTKVKYALASSPTRWTTINLGKVNALLFGADVDLSGESKNRVTIAAYRTDQQVKAANVTIVGHTGTEGHMKNKFSNYDSLGIIAEGSVFIQIAADSGKLCEVNYLTAAVVAMTGSFGLEQKFTGSVRPKYDNPLCGAMTVTGSVASHRTPVLRWGWGGAGRDSGFTTRKYLWDPRLKVNTPPYYPLSDQWHVVGRSSVNDDCIDRADAQLSIDRGCQ